MTLANAVLPDMEALRREGFNLVESRLLQTLGDDWPATLPVVPERIARRLGIGVVRQNLGGVAGLLVPLEDGCEMRINAAHPVQRQNFTCAHEISHYLLSDEEGQQLLDRVSSAHGWEARRDLEERLCDMGAAGLLMPRRAFSRYASEYEYGVDALGPLARVFNTSILATAVRLTDVSPRKCFMVKWTVGQDGELGELGLCASWVLSSRGRRFQFHRRATRNDSIASAYASDEKTLAQECMKLGGFRGLCNIESRGYGAAPHRCVVSLIFPEFEN